MNKFMNMAEVKMSRYLLTIKSILSLSGMENPLPVVNIFIFTTINSMNMNMNKITTELVNMNMNKITTKTCEYEYKSALIFIFISIGEP